MSLLAEAARQRVEFLRQNLGEPDVCIIPFDKQFEFLGELSMKHQPVIDHKKLYFMGMRVIYVDPDYASKLTVCMSADRLAKGTS